ncbi:hypothetical protein F5146DRAFT_927265 [Armillaria mellea]|nr:hypothetical protein F5146DRAFT_927265 [Armillaria mellea]
MARTSPPFEDPLSPIELLCTHQPYLQSLGYMLHPRCHPDWHTSWIKKDGMDLREKYSFLTLERTSIVLDAIRMEDHVKIALRIVPVGSHEYATMMNLLPEMCSDPCSHTVPVLGTVQIPGEENKRVFAIIPVLFWVHTPDFYRQREFFMPFA